MNLNADMIIKSKDQLLAIQEDYMLRRSGYEWEALVCSGAGCISSQCQVIKEALEEALHKHELEDRVLVKVTGCMGACDLGPTLIIEPQGVLYCHLMPEQMESIVKGHFLQGKTVIQHTYSDPKTKERVPYLKDIPFFQGQEKLVLKNCGQLDYRSLDEYIAKGGFFALDKALHQMTPESVIEEVVASGLRGRGGGGFPTGLKWKLAAKKEAKEKYIICNADEGDPGAFMDRSLLEGDPFNILEGMMIAGYAMGAQKGFVYVRAEYPVAIERLGEAIEAAKTRGLLGEHILGSDLSFDVEIRIGAGAFVCGEETALMASVEGKRGEPRQKPPYPSDSGLFGHPTVINNVETLGNIAAIVQQGAAFFTKFGTDKSKGTKVFALAGDINNTGLVEVPMGRTLGEILFDIGGGIPRGKRFKVAQTGGPSGGCITGKNLNVPVDYESLAELGAIMGSGGLICMDEDTCMVDVARYFMEFVQDESCGKCLACRVGTKRMLEILERITKGQGKEGDVELLQELALTIKDTALCGLGQTAPNPVLSTIEYFREEYDEHIRDKYCRAGVCSDLFVSPCENACPAHVNAAGYIALIAAGRPLDAYRLVRQENPLPSICGRVCTHPCESKCRRAQLDEPIAICDLKRYAADEAMKHMDELVEPVLPRKGYSVGVIGGGPSGLTCAYYLARLGYEVTVYESHPLAGGVLSFGIPEYRLPQDVIEKEIALIRRVGVTILTNMEVGKDIEFSVLRKKHDAIYIATGTQHAHKVGMLGEDLPGVYHGLSFLRDLSFGKEIPVKGIVAVIGGGNTAIDGARVALRKGASEVHLFYRRSKEDMPADAREIEEALEEGVLLHELASPLEIRGQDKVESLVYQEMELQGFTEDGRRKPIPKSSEPRSLRVDMVIPAVSQYSDLPFVGKDEVEMTKWGTFVVDDNSLMTTMEGVYAGGDVVRGSDVVIQAIADGKKAAQAIDMRLGGTGTLYKGENIEIPQDYDDAELEEHDRFPMDTLSPDKRRTNFDEVVQRYHRLNAMAEAMRCLRCDRRL